MKNSLFLIFILLAICTQSQSLYFVPEDTEVGLSTAFTTELFIGDIEDLIAFEFEITFDPQVIEATEVTIEDAFIGSTGRTVFPVANNIDNSTGLIQVAVTTLGSEPGVDGTGLLVTIEWLSASGLTSVGFTDLILQNVQVLDSDAQPIPVDLLNATVAVYPPIEADFEADNTIPLVSETVGFTDLSTNSPSSWEWNITPSTATYVDGTDEYSQHPNVSFNAAGSYTVALTASNGGSSDTETKADYIVVYELIAADFEADDVTPVIDQTISFTDLSSGYPTAWSWEIIPSTIDWEDGTNENSQHPHVSFNATGTYTVMLTASHGGDSDTETKTDYINVFEVVAADFEADNLCPLIGDAVIFTDLSAGSPTSWSWTFSPATVTYIDGTNASSQHPHVSFDAAGSYTVGLAANNGGDSDNETKTDYILVCEVIAADFEADDVTPTIDETVTFTDLSTGSPTSWSWEFTPSTVSFLPGFNENSQHPPVSFNATGTYTVMLTASHCGDSDTETKVDYISVFEVVAADFEADNLCPLIGDAVIFTDLSTGSPTSWSWTFSPATVTYIDGTNASSQHPHVSFDVAGSYTVELTASNGGDSDTETKTDYILVCEVIDADFEADDVTPAVGETVTFTDLSTGSPTSWDWVFTPSTVSFLPGSNPDSQHPQVSFNATGTYTVELLASNCGDSDTETKTDYISVFEVVVADFEADNLTPIIDETVIFTDLSTGSPTNWSWTFSPSTITYIDGTSADSQHPHVSFDEDDLYSVELLASNEGGSDTEFKPSYINVGNVFDVVATATPGSICYGHSSLLQAFASGGSGNYTYTWTSDPEGFNSNEQNPTVYPEVTTTYFVEVNDGNDYINDTVIVIVNPLPEITLIDWPDTLCNVDPPIQLMASPSGGEFDGTGVSIDGVFTPGNAQLGWNEVTYTYMDVNGCSSSASDLIFVDVCPGTSELSINKFGNVIIYPNPTAGEFAITSTNNIIRFDVISQMGRLVFSEDNESKEVHFQRTLPNGIYYVRIFLRNKSDVKIICKKLLIR